MASEPQEPGQPLSQRVAQGRRRRSDSQDFQSLKERRFLNQPAFRQPKAEQPRQRKADGPTDCRPSHAEEQERNYRMMADAPKETHITAASFSGLPPRSGLIPSFFSSSVFSQRDSLSAIWFASLTDSS